MAIQYEPGHTTRLEPKLVTALREGYSLAQLGRDAVAGFVVGVVALPLAIAFGIASGVKPEQGLYTAIIGGFLISALGGSRVQIGGPTGAFIVLVYEIVQQHGYAGLALATVMAGAMLILMGVARLGSVIQFIPYPVTVGFTSGIALLIAVSQGRDFLGLRMEAVPVEFVEKLAAYAEHVASWNPWAFAVALGSLATVQLWPRITHRIPGPLVALVAATALVQLAGIPVETIGSRFGAVPRGLPSPQIPIFDWETARALSTPAMAIALLAAIESLLSAVVADGMLGTRHRPNMELVAQGVANLASPIFGGIPATGAIARTATNVRSGGRTPIAGLVHAATLLLIVLFFADWAEWIPIPALAGILLVVAWNMSEWRHFVHLFRMPRSDVLVLLATFSLTVLVDITVALEVGIVLAALLFMRRMASLSQAGYVTRMLSEDEDRDDPLAIARRTVPAGVEVFEVQGALFFGAATKFRESIQQVETPPRVLVVRLRHVLAIDASGLRELELLCDESARHGTAVVLSGVHAQPLVALERSGLLEKLGEANVCGDIDLALARADVLLGAGV
ncbi:MAG: sodium-independent anion transporter [Proteobacteria bacterium]|nr:MAG: sodium-independent anion transporter [Pseudomonadota bacterium]